MISHGSDVQRLDQVQRLLENADVWWLYWSGGMTQSHKSHPNYSEFRCHCVDLFVNKQASADDLPDRFNRFYADKLLIQS
jgi:hypothetical protein